MALANKKWIQWGFGGLCLTTLIAAIFFALLPHLLRLPTVRQNLETYFDQQLEGRITYHHLSLYYFPRPRIQLQGVSIAIPGRIRGNIARLIVTPRLLPLLQGKIKISSIEAITPNCSIQVSEPTENIKDFLSKQNIVGFFARHETVPEFLKQLSTVEIQSGHIGVEQKGKPAFSFHNINGIYQHILHVGRFRMSCGSNLWKKASVDLSLHYSAFKGKGTIRLYDFSPHKLTDHLWSNTSFRLTAAKTNVRCNFTIEHPDRIAVSLNTTDSTISIQKNGTEQQFKARSASGTLILSPQKTKVTVTNADLMVPKMKVNGHYQSNKDRSGIEWRIDAEDIGVPDLRKAALFLAGNFKTTQNIAKVVQGGFIPQLSIEQRATAVSRLKNVDNLRLQGTIRDGDIYVPGPKLPLKKVHGDVRVTNGILTAQSADAQLGNSVGQSGSFSMDLHPAASHDFRVACNVTADLKQLPPLLERLVANKALRHEMAQVENAKGSATGKLTVERAEGQVTVEVDVSAFELAADYDRIPFPVSLQGGGFIYRNGGIELSDIRGAVGASTFSKINAALDWKNTLHLSIPSGAAVLKTDELYPWFRSFTAFSKTTDYLQSLNGELAVSKMSFNGPLLSPGSWQYAVATTPKQLSVKLPLFSEPIQCQGGGIAFEPNVISFNQTHVSVLDADTYMTGSLQDYLEDKRAFDADFHGSAGSAMSLWIQNHSNVPNECRWKAPITVSAMHLHWEVAEGFDVTMAASLQNDLMVSLEASLHPEVFLLKHLSIKDKHSDATITLHRKADTADFAFHGKLSATTLDTLLMKNTMLSGAVQGNFQGCYFDQMPEKSTIDGELHADGLQFYKFKWPIQIEQLTLKGGDTKLNISQARLIWENDLVFLTGTIAHFNDGLKMDMDLIADQLDWQRICHTFFESKESVSNTPWPIPLYGKLHVSTGTFRFSDAATFGPFETKLTFDKGTMTADLLKAELCGFSIPGSIIASQNHRQFSLAPTAEDQDLSLPFSCIGNDKIFMDGQFSANSIFTANVKPDEPIAPACKGEVFFTAHNGRIYRFSLLARIFTLLNIPGLLGGDFPSLEKEGFPYKEAHVKGTFENGVLRLTEGVIDSAAMKIFFHGEENYLLRDHNMTIVVAPLKGVDMVVEKIPLVSDVLSKGFVFYPVKVTGPWENPKLQPVSTEAVGKEVLGIIGRTLNLPATILKKVLPKSKE